MMKKMIFSVVLALMGMSTQAQTVAELDSITKHLEEIGYFYEALDLLDQCEERTPDLSRRQGTLLYAIGEYPASIGVMRELVDADTTFNIKDYLLLANSYQALLIPDSAIYYREAIAKAYPFNESNLVILLQLARSNNMSEEYLGLLTDFLKVHPGSKPIRRELAHTLYAMKDYSASQDEFQTLYDAGDKNVNTLYYLGSLLLMDKSLRSSMRAEKVLAEAVEYSQGGTPLILSDLALAKTRLKLLDQAMTLIEEADSLTFRTPEILTFSAQLEERRAQIYLERQQWKPGVKYLKRAYEIDPSNRRVLYMIARTYRKLNDWDNEERYLNALLKETDPNTIEGSEWAKYAKSRLLSIKEERFMQKK